MQVHKRQMLYFNYECEQISLTHIMDKLIKYLMSEYLIRLIKYPQCS